MYEGRATHAEAAVIMCTWVKVKGEERAGRGRWGGGGSFARNGVVELSKVVVQDSEMQSLVRETE